MPEKKAKTSAGPTFAVRVLVWIVFMAGGGLSGLLGGALYSLQWTPPEGIAAALALPATKATLVGTGFGAALWLVCAFGWCRWIRLSPLSQPDLRPRPSGMIPGIGAALGAAVGLVGGLLGGGLLVCVEPRFLDVIFRTNMFFAMLKFQLALPIAIGLLTGLAGGVIWWLAAWQVRHTCHKKP